MDDPLLQAREPEHFALVTTSLLFGVLSIFAPAYFDADGWQEAALHLGGVLFAILGFVGLAKELGRLPANEAMSDFGTASILLLVALLASLAVETWRPPSPFSGSLRILVALCLFWGIYGTASGTEKSIRGWRARPLPARPSWSTSLLPLILGVLTVLTAVINLVAAFQTARPK